MTNSNIKQDNVQANSQSVQCCLYLSSFFKYLTCNFDDLELGLFKVIQCQTIISFCHNTRMWQTDTLYYEVTIFVCWCCPCINRGVHWELMGYQNTQGFIETPWVWVMVSIESPFMVSYLTFICLTLYLSWYSRYLMWKFCDLGLWRFKIIYGQRSWCQSITHRRLPIRRLLTATSYLSPFLEYFTSNFDDVELGQFKLTQGQRSRCQSMAQGRFHFHIRLPLTPSWYLSPFSRYLTLKLFSIGCKLSELNRKYIDAHVRLIVPVLLAIKLCSSLSDVWPTFQIWGRSDKNCGRYRER